MRTSSARRFIERGLISLLVVSAFGCHALAQEKPNVETVPQVGHSDFLTSVAFSPGGARVLTGSDDDTAKLWDTGTGKLLRTFAGHSYDVTSVAFSPDGARMLTGSRDGTAKLWDARTGKLIRTFEGHMDDVTSVAFSPDGARMLTGSRDGTAKLWDAGTGRLLKTFEGHSGWLTSVAFSTDGARVLTGGSDNTAKLWDAGTGRLLKTFEGHSGWLTSVAYSPDGTRVLTGSRDKTAKLWDAVTGRLLTTFNGHSDRVTSVAFSPDGARVLTGSDDGTAKLWDAVTGKVLTTYEGHSDRVTSVAFSPVDGARVLTGSWDHTAKLWDADTGKLIRSFEGPSHLVSAVAVTPDGRQLVSGSRDKTVKLWDLQNGRLIRSFEGHSSWVSAVAVTPDGRQLVSGCRDETVKLWDLQTGKLIRSFEAHSGWVSAVAVTPDGRHLVSSGNGERNVKLWDLQTGKLIRSFEGHFSWVRAVAVTPDGRHLVSGAGERNVKLWDLQTGKLIRNFEAHFEDHTDSVMAVAVTPDGRHLVSGNRDGTAMLWDLQSGKLIRSFEAHSGWVWAVAVTPDGRQLVSGSRDETVKLWDLQSGKLIRSFEDHTNSVRAVAVTPDGRHLVSGSWDGTVKLWDLEQDQRNRTDQWVATFIGSKDDQWLTITPAGFFASSSGGREMLAVVRGLEPYSVTQFFDHLYRPDLIAEVLKGDPEGKHKDAAYKLNLETILDSGPAPQLELQNKKTEKAGGTVRLTLRITSTGGGIGEKLIWRVNGLTQGNPTPPELEDKQDDPLGTAIVTQTLKVDPGQKNIVEVTAYNGAGLLATPPLHITIDPFGVTTEERPRMHVLALGVNKYRMKKYELRYAAKDAKDFAQALKVVGSTLFADVSVTTLINEQVTRDQIAAAFDQIAAEAKATDVFVFYLAGHGKSIAGRYYYYPQDLDFASGQTVKTDGIGQDLLQAWLAKVGHVTKSLVIVDTCESGAWANERGTNTVRETAMEQLQHATGHNLIAAARDSQAAREGYKGHGVLTYALLEALNVREGASEDEKVEVSDLADHVDERVPEITQSLWGVRQQPTRKLTGNDFPIGIRQAVLTKTVEIPTIPTHVLKRTERVRETPAADAPGERELPPGTAVHVVEFADDWAVIARDGQKLGYVPVEALLKIQ